MTDTQMGHTTRQRGVRILDIIDDWLQQCARDTRQADPDSRAGIATEINGHLLAAFKADPRNADKIALLPADCR